jgi:DNA-binding LacI/PurR family transcriptional regulator
MFSSNYVQTDNRAQIQVAGRNLVQHGHEQEEVFAIDQRDLDIRLRRQAFFQFGSDTQAAETTTENDYLFHGITSAPFAPLYAAACFDDCCFSSAKAATSQ